MALCSSTLAHSREECFASRCSFLTGFHGYGRCSSSTRRSTTPTYTPAMGEGVRGEGVRVLCHYRSLNMFRGFPQWDPAHHHIWQVPVAPDDSDVMCLRRHVIQYMRDCFYDNQTWEECENQTFRDLATTSAAESARSLQQTREGGDCCTVQS